MTSPLAGRRLLIVEDEYFLADDLASTLRAEGAEVVGLASNVDAALEMLESAGVIDGAVVDLNLQGEMAYPVADALRAQNIPFVFATGYDLTAIEPGYRDLPRCEKPVKAQRIAQLLFG